MLLQWSMYYLSFTPLWVSVLFMEIMSLRHGAEYRGTEIVSLVLIPVIFIIAVFKMKNGLKPTKTGAVKYELEEAVEEKLVTAEFLATFIIPLFAFDFTTWEGMVLFGFFFLVFGWLCVRHNYFCTNIMLDVFNYRIYECKMVDGQEVEIERKIISKRNLKLCQGTYIYSKGLNNDYGFDCFEPGDIENEENE